MNQSRSLGSEERKATGALRSSEGMETASVHANGQFIDVASCVSYRSVIHDRSRAHFQLEASAPEKDLGAALVACLQSSLSADLEEFRRVQARSQASYEAWVQAAISKFRYRSRRQLFLEMVSVAVRSEADTILLRPSHHADIEGWSGLPVSTCIQVQRDADVALIGGALRQALAACTSPW